MAELTGDPCCTPQQRTTCCEPETKSDCCGHEQGCGCSPERAHPAGADVRETVRDRTRRGNFAPAAVGAYIGAAYFFTSSASFANPAITIGRMFSNSFAGIAPASVPGFIVAQLVGGIVAVITLRALYPHVTADEAADIVLPHSEQLADAR